MSRHAEVRLPWGDGEQTFRLGIGQLRELQEKTDAGPWEIGLRLRSQACRVDDVLEPLRLGLIGGGMPPTKAFALVKKYGEGRPLEESRLTAWAIIMAALVGAPEEEVGKKAEGETAPEPSPSPTENSGSPPSTVTVQ